MGGRTAFGFGLGLELDAPEAISSTPAMGANMRVSPAGLFGGGAGKGLSLVLSGVMLGLDRLSERKRRWELATNIFDSGRYACWMFRGVVPRAGRLIC